MRAWLMFIAGIATELLDLYEYVQRPAAERNPADEQRIAMRIVRKASDEQARREIVGP